MLIESWQNNWQQRFRSIIHELGYQNTFSFVMLRTGESFGKMFRIIRDFANDEDKQFLAFTHLSEMFYIDAFEIGQFKTAVAESLVRSIQQSFRKGWNKGKRIRERRIDVRTNWPIPFNIQFNNWSFQDWCQFQDEVISLISKSNPPDDWCPIDYRDPVVSVVFDTIWSEFNNKT